MNMLSDRVEIISLEKKAQYIHQTFCNQHSIQPLNKILRHLPMNCLSQVLANSITQRISTS